MDQLENVVIAVNAVYPANCVSSFDENFTDAVDFQQRGKFFWASDTGAILLRALPTLPFFEQVAL